MLDPEIELFPPTSPTISSVSSSDFDTESTGSFFHDRSTSLGTLMGVNFPTISARVSTPDNGNNNILTSTIINGGGRGKRKKLKNKKGLRKVVIVDSSENKGNRRWWQLCRDEETKPPSSSLADFLEVERRFGDGDRDGDGDGDGDEFYGVAELEGIVHEHLNSNQNQSSGNGRLLFADGRVLPPSTTTAASSQDVTAEEGPPIVDTLCRFPVLLSGICSGGGAAATSGNRV
ncbi:hypothetical protein MKW94_022348 [Papaver nudicaule]|uniref:Uncharacterized protein n=1 Tax=Papaver nudicaule TaxID=74823 RepID=A0AA41VJ61_PAPNU|nr:hypothetical protein [Papaver nudicaule]